MLSRRVWHLTQRLQRLVSPLSLPNPVSGDFCSSHCLTCAPLARITQDIGPGFSLTPCGVAVENHTFDNYFQTCPRANGATTGSVNSLVVVCSGL